MRGDLGAQALMDNPLIWRLIDCPSRASPLIYSFPININNSLAMATTNPVTSRPHWTKPIKASRSCSFSDCEPRPDHKATLSFSCSLIHCIPVAKTAYICHTSVTYIESYFIEYTLKHKGLKLYFYLSFTQEVKVQWSVLKVHYTYIFLSRKLIVPNPWQGSAHFNTISALMCGSYLFGFCHFSVLKKYKKFMV